MNEKKYSSILKFVIIGTALIIIYKLVNNFSDVAAMFKGLIGILKPCIFGVIIAFFLNGPVKKLIRLFDKSRLVFVKKHSKAFSLVIVYLALFAVIGIICGFVVPELVDNITHLVVNRNKYIKQLTDFINSIEFLAQFDSLMKLPETYLKNFDVSKLLGYVGVLTNIVGYVFDIVVSLVISVYVLIEKEGMFSFLRALQSHIFNNRRGALFVKYVKKIVNVFYSYFCGLGLDSVVVGTISAIVFSIFDVPYALLLGIVVIVANMIPMFGPVVAGGIVYIVCAFAFGPLKAIWAVAFQLILGQIDGNIIQPYIVGGKVGISPLLVLVSVTLFGGLFGVAGMIIGVPVCAALKMLVIDWMDNGEIDGSGLEKNK